MRAADLDFLGVFLGKTLAIIWRICYDGGTEQIKRKPIGVRRIDFALPDGFTDLYRSNRGVLALALAANRLF